jgi:hypothetical protein
VPIFSAPLNAQPASDFLESADAWHIITSEGVQLSMRTEPGLRGNCLRLDYEFTKGAGYGIIQRDWPETLPQDWEFSFFVRAKGPPNNLEFKLIDATGENVWWINRRAFDWPGDWTRLINRKRRFEFAWGPSAGAPLTSLSKIEFAIASNQGGCGTVWLDELTFREVPLPSGPSVLTGSASSSEDETHSPDLAVDGRTETTWRASLADASPWLALSNAAGMEFAGVIVDWEPHHAPTEAVLEASDDGATWMRLSPARRVWSGSSVFVTPDAQARHVRLRLRPGASAPGVREVRFRAPEHGAPINHALAALAKESPRGQYPRPFLDEQCYWTVIGAEDHGIECLLSEDGSLELGKQGPSVEPFLIMDDRLITWSDGQSFQELEGGDLPLPLVRRRYDCLELETAPFVVTVSHSLLVPVEYRLRNTGTHPIEGRLGVALRPMQVNPPWQRLNFEGGWSPLRSLVPTKPGGGLCADGWLRIVSLATGSQIIATPFDGADIVARLRSPPEPLDSETTDPEGLASGAIVHSFNLAPGQSQTFVIVCVLEGSLPDAIDASWVAEARSSVIRQWRHRLEGVQVQTPDAWIARTLRSQIAYILLNRDGPAIQPGSRSYERSWARDGSMTAAALLSCGLHAEAKAWVDWYAEHLFENGKVPCVVDRRGPDPVPEHDSHGQYLWAVANVHRHTRDAEFLTRHWTRVQRTVAYIRSLRAERMTADYAAQDSPKGAFHGLVPESISHEGYSAKPMHSYWDDFFVLLGLKEAAYLAREAGDEERAREYAALAEEFRACLYESIRLVTREKEIDFIPGCVELGDFDPTSTTIALYPCDELRYAPADLLRNTFERAWRHFESRRREDAWDACTPYEIRQANAFIRLEQPERAIELLDWFHRHQRPASWNHWAEVVWHNERAPRFIGDMPHTWVGSDFIHAIRSIFVYESGDSLIAFAGVPRRWLDTGEEIAARGFVTPYGTFDGSMRRQGRHVVVHIGDSLRPPPGGIILRRPPGAVGADVHLTRTPAEVTFDLGDR